MQSAIPLIAGVDYKAGIIPNPAIGLAINEAKRPHSGYQRLLPESIKVTLGDRK
jgi:hypothetical protein